MHPAYPEDQRRNVARQLSQYYAELAGNAPAEPPAFSLGRMLSKMTQPQGLRDGYEDEICGSAAMIAGRRPDPHKVTVPFSALLAKRDLQVSLASAGGYLVAQQALIARDVLRPYSITTRAGVTILAGLTDTLTLPQVAAGSAAVGSWGAVENAAAPHTQSTIGEAALAPKHATAFTRFSRQLTLQADQTEPFIRGQLLEAVAGLLDQAVISGTGASGQPLGLVNTAGIGTQSGTSLAYAGIRTMRKQILLAGGLEDRLAWVGAPDVQDVLSGRERAAGGGRFLWDDNGIMGRPAYASSYVAAGTLACGDWSRVVVGLWGPGFVVEINPFENFQGLKFSARIILECDVMFSPTNAFSVSTSVT